MVRVMFSFPRYFSVCCWFLFHLGTFSQSRAH